MTFSVLLKNATLTDLSRVDVGISGENISYVEPAGNAPHCENTIDLTGHVLSVGFVEPHAHLDKAFLADRIDNAAGDLAGAIAGLHNVRHTLTHEDMVERAIRALTLMSVNGVTSVRTHADTTLDGGLTSVLALLEAKERCAHFIDVEVAMLLEWPISGAEGASRRALAQDAVSAGVDVVGGCPHLDEDPHGAIRWLVEFACETGLPLDLHADENLRPTSHDLETVADIVLSQGIKHHINASHCVSLSTLEKGRIISIAQKVAEAGITVTALPQTNLYLQGRDLVTNVPRAVTPVSLLQHEGVTVAAGADNLQDPFNVVGRGDPLEIASLLVTASHLTPRNAFEMVSTHAAQVVHRRAPSIAVGQSADLVAIPASTVRESVAMGSPDRTVVYGGVVLTDQKRNRK